MEPKLVSMKMSAAERKKYTEPPAIGEEEYPYGLRLSLDNETLGKLKGLDRVDVGDEVMIVARAKVVSKHESTNETDTNRGLDLQIEEMAADGQMSNAKKLGDLYPTMKK